jgi:hypothetical protein
VREIRVLRDGFRLIFTAPVDAKSAADPASYLAEHYRYEYTGAYGSPELDRTRAAIDKARSRPTDCRSISRCRRS